jgi:hypothetical protein
MSSSSPEKSRSVRGKLAPASHAAMSALAPPCRIDRLVEVGFDRDGAPQVVVLDDALAACGFPRLTSARSVVAAAVEASAIGASSTRITIASHPGAHVSHAPALRACRPCRASATISPSTCRRTSARHLAGMRPASRRASRSSASTSCGRPGMSSSATSRVPGTVRTMASSASPAARSSCGVVVAAHLDRLFHRRPAGDHGEADAARRSRA